MNGRSSESMNTLGKPLWLIGSSYNFCAVQGVSLRLPVSSCWHEIVIGFRNLGTRNFGDPARVKVVIAVGRCQLIISAMSVRPSTGSGTLRGVVLFPTWRGRSEREDDIPLDAFPRS